MKKNFLLLLMLFCCFQRVFSAYVPVTVTSGFNADIIANGIGNASASSTPIDVPNNYAFVSADFKATAGSAAPTYALPSNGLINSVATTGLNFQIADYNSNNALMLSSTVNTGTLNFSATGIADVYLLAASANGDANFDAVVHFSDGTSQTFSSLTASDWYNNSGYAIEGIGRIDVTTNSLDGTSSNPRLYQLVLHLDAINYTKTITNISFSSSLSGDTAMGILGITTNSACTGTPATATTTATTVNACSGLDFTLSLGSFTADGGTTFQWATSPDGINWTPVATGGGTDATYTTNQSVVTYYQCTITCSGSGLSSTSSSLMIGQNPPNQCYCIPAYYQGCSDNFGDFYDINGVQILGENGTSINNVGTGCSANNSYSDYTSSVSPVSITPFGNYTIALSSSDNYASGAMYATTWIDLNDDGLFDDNTERVATTGNNSGLTMTLSVSSSNAGLHRMRIRAVWYNYNVVSDPCGDYDDGETEDYMVNILPVPSCIQPLNIAAVDNANGTSSDINWTAGATGTTYDYAVDQSNTLNPDPASTIVNTTLDNVNIPNLSTGINYYFHIRSHCSATDSSVWALSAFVVSSSCGNATEIAIGSITTGSNANFSSVTLPSDNSCGSSSFSGVSHAAWYKITSTNAGTIAVSTVGNTNYDTYLRVYSGDCSNLICEGYDDDYNFNSYSISTSSSYLTFSADANTTYYILMAGYGSGSVGNFTLQANYLPTNDDATGAITLTAGAGCTGASYSNLGGTVSSSEPYPSCSGTQAVSPVWFKFNAPASGTAKITTDFSVSGLSDTRLGLFQVGDVTDYSTFNLIGCDDDNGVLGSGNLSTLYATGLTPGGTYYVEVDDGNDIAAGGAFCITVDEINPTMLSISGIACGDIQQPTGSDNTYTGWITLADNNGNLVAMVKNAAGSYPSDFTGSYTVNGTGIRQDANGVYYLNRNYFINNPLISTPVDVQLFFSPGEYGYLNGITGSTGTAVTMNDLNVTKQEGSTCAADYDQGLGPVSVLTQTSNNTVNGVGWIQVSTSSFSNFYIMGGTNPLLITLKSIEAENIGSSNKVTWSTASENVGDYFELERSADAKTFSFLAKKASNQKASDYVYYDNTPLQNINYYRLKMISSDGKVVYSKIVQATVTGKDEASIELYPNPTNENVTLKVYGSSDGSVSLTDISGRVIYQTKMAGNELQIDMSNLVNGFYLIHYVDDNLNKVIKVNKQ